MSIIIHSKSGCSYCVKAKEFMTTNNIPYEEIYYDADSEDYQDKKDELLSRTNHKTFPQIFVGDTFIGGYTELISSYSTLKLHELCKEIGIELEYDF
jgi:glutaredoxin 3